MPLRQTSAGVVGEGVVSNADVGGRGWVCMVAETGISNGDTLLDPWMIPTWLPVKDAINSRTTACTRR